MSHTYFYLFLVGALFLTNCCVSHSKSLDEVRRSADKRQSNKRPENKGKKYGVDEFLEKFGYLSKVPPHVGHSADARQNAIKNFQRMYNLKVTGRMDNETTEKMQMPRCGMPDMMPKEIQTNRTINQLIAENYFVPGYKWLRKQLTWKAHNYFSSHEISPSTQRWAFYKAFKYWSDVSSLQFSETTGEADINLKFGYRDHGDGSQNAFDGPGGVLAHAYYPQSGETHFDQEERWTDENQEGINLLMVTTHELGHALGLGHSNVEGAIMAPFYAGYIPNFSLHDDDIKAIQFLYGGPVQPTTTVPTTTTIPTTTTPVTTTPNVNPPDGKPDSCTIPFSAILETHDYRIYVMYGDWLWRISRYGLDPGFPTIISNYYENAPSNINAAIFSWRSYYTYFFKGSKIWRYYGFRLVDIKDNIDPNYPKYPHSAVALRDGTIYLMKRNLCWVFDERTMDILMHSQQYCSSILPYSPPNVDSALRLQSDGFIYFFKGDSYYKYDENTRRVMDGYPKLKSKAWMGPACGGSYWEPR